MDRLEAMRFFVEVADRGGFAAAGRQLRGSPASVTRAIAQLEDELDLQLLRRTTRSLALTETGTQYLAACRDILARVAEADALAIGERLAPRGQLAISAPVAFGRLFVRPIVDAFLATYHDVSARLVLVDRMVDLIEEGVDVAIRIAALADSSLVATKVGEVTRVVCASPAYLKARGTPKSPAELARHDVIAFTQAFDAQHAAVTAADPLPRGVVTPADVWMFGARRVAVRPRLAVNTADAAVASALAGLGITRVLSYQVDAELRAGRLVRVLASEEPPPLPVQIVYAAGSVQSAKVRTFVDLAVPRLRKALGSHSSRGAVGA